MSSYFRWITPYHGLAFISVERLGDTYSPFSFDFRYESRFVELPVWLAGTDGIGVWAT